MNTSKKLQFESLPENYWPHTLPEILKLAKKINSDTALIYERANKPFFMETERLIIRRFTVEDAKAVCELSNDRMRSSMRNFDHQWPTDIKGCKEVAAYFAGEDIFYAVCLKPSMKLIGFIAYNSVNDDGIMDLGHVWHTAYQDNSFDTEALSLMTQYAFEKLGANGMTAGNPLECEEQIAPLKAIGMEIVEIREKASFINDKNGNPIEFTGCKMLITREKWEANNPESYSPKNKPEILRVAEEGAGKIGFDKVYNVKTANDGSYIDGVPMLKWGEWRDNTYCGTIAAVMEVLHEPISYETLMGVSGLCYRFAIKPDWCPSSALSQNGTVYDNNIHAAIGIEMYGITDTSERDERVKLNLASGWPVICIGQIGSPEWGIITGYSGKDSVFFGRSYFDTQNTNPASRYYSDDSIFHTENKYRRAVNYPGVYPEGFLKFFDKPYLKAKPLNLLEKSLESCLAYYKHDEFNECKFGAAAFRILIKGFEKNDKEWQTFRQNENYHLGVLVDARRCAYVYLQESASMLKGRNKEKLLDISKAYKSIVDDILAIVPYKMMNENFAFNGNNEEPWSSDIRQRLVAALNKATDTEKRIQSAVKDILKHWDT